MDNLKFRVFSFPLRCWGQRCLYCTSLSVGQHKWRQYLCSENHSVSRRGLSSLSEGTVLVPVLLLTGRCSGAHSEHLHKLTHQQILLYSSGSLSLPNVATMYHLLLKPAWSQDDYRPKVLAISLRTEWRKSFLGRPRWSPSWQWHSYCLFLSYIELAGVQSKLIQDNDSQNPESANLTFMDLTLRELIIQPRSPMWCGGLVHIYC